LENQTKFIQCEENQFGDFSVDFMNMTFFSFFCLNERSHAGVIAITSIFGSNFSDLI